MVKETKGRQKIAIKRIENKRNLEITFCKRRNGLMMKANELSTLCGVELAVVVFSPTARAHSFGVPNPDDIIHRFLHDEDINAENSSKELGESPEDTIKNSAKELDEVKVNVAEERTRRKRLDQDIEEFRHQTLWNAPISRLNLSELAGLENALVGLKIKVEGEKDILEAFL